MSHVEQLLQQHLLAAGDFTATRTFNLANGLASTAALLGNACATSHDELSSTSPSTNALLSVTTASTLTARNSSKTLKCPKCNWHYKYQETLEIHMKEKHADQEVNCTFCVRNQPHPRLARGESYSCGYKPYRCDICKYSTTTKGNLSIHMQSDKHLHAIQEMPPVVSHNPMNLSAEADIEFTLQCMICSMYSTDSLAEMIDHIEKDRGQPVIGDIAIVHGMYQCNLCPYSTSLKANFQLHTRTDKHVQRIQMVNL